MRAAKSHIDVLLERRPVELDVDGEIAAAVTDWETILGKWESEQYVQVETD